MHMALLFVLMGGCLQQLVLSLGLVVLNRFEIGALCPAQNDRRYQKDTHKYNVLTKKIHSPYNFLSR
ncbi:protein of unknown function [Candidatus Promineifilum breve]|uniref:Uncharacterized protein n=1 Tax=Candidatus Promineifilum breve TaxID=1806508 RepID=A0A160T3L3_9CHLR|nr:protein of unknown function [Candidatus Promineifilum breve]